MRARKFRAPHTVWACLLIGVLAAAPARAYTPESPEVKQMVRRGLEFLESSDDDRLGGKCLIALAFLKEAYPERHSQIKNHPKILAAVQACKEAVAEGENIKGKQGVIYSLGIAVIFLCELDADLYRTEIDAMLGLLRKYQKPHGGWGYLNRENGDTSMTQYGVLSAWTARKKHVDVPQPSVEAVANWLLRTQQTDGGFGYQAVDPGHYNGASQRKDQVTLSMGAAGTGSVLMAANLLGFIKIKEQPHEKGVPTALTRVSNGTKPDERKPAAPAAVQVDPAQVNSAVQRGNRWFEANYKIDWGPHTHYYLYALERYKSFLELAENNQPEEPAWYNDGVNFLQKTQKRNGSWQSDANDGAQIDTSFAILFLVRSTQKSIGRIDPLAGLLSGGRGLGSEIVRNGQVIKDPLARQADQLLKILNDPDHPDYQRVLADPKNVMLAEGGEIDREQAQRLRQLIAGGEPEVRQAAVQALAHTRDLDHVPTLIYALTDPDWRVVRAARDGLRFISRKFGGYGIPDNRDDEKRELGIRAWKKWYLTIRPDAVFLEG